VRYLIAILLTVVMAESQSQYRVDRSDSTVAPSSLPPQVLFDLRAQSPAAQQALLPLYQREWGLEQQLNAVKWQALADNLMGLAVAVGGLTDGSAGARAANNAAARAGTPGTTFKGENAATSAQQTAGTPESVNTAMYLVNQIGATEDAISRTQNIYGISPTARTPWSILFPPSKKLTPAEVTKLLEPAATIERERNFSVAQSNLQKAADDALKSANKCLSDRSTCVNACAGSTSCMNGCENCDPKFAATLRIQKNLLDLQQEHLRQMQQ
jgi:hypothetical protein